MASFAHLPFELIHQIFLKVLPADLENFAQACQKVYSVAQSHLKAHRTLIRNFATVGNNIKGDGSPFGQVLFDILINPIHAHYIINLHYRCCSTPRLYDLVRVKQDFRELITLLPNLKTLTMEDVDLSDFLVQFQNVPFTDPPTLTKLASIYVRFPTESRSLQSLRITRALSNLPSLKLLSTQNCGFQDVEPGFFAPFPSLLTRLELWDCHVQAKELQEFLKGFHQLQTFKHSTPFALSPGRDYDTSLIGDGLLSSKTTLQHLTLLAPGQSASFIGSLAEFEFFQEVYISWNLLVPRWGLHDPYRLSWMLPKPLLLLRIENEGGQYSSDYPSDNSRLVTCIVNGRGCMWHYSQLVDSVLLCKSTQAQSLTELVLVVGQHWKCSADTSSPLSQDLPLLQRRCIETGIVLTIN